MYLVNGKKIMYPELRIGNLIKFNDTKKIYLITCIERMSHSTVYIELLCSNLARKKIMLDSNDPYMSGFKILN